MMHMETKVISLQGSATEETKGTIQTFPDLCLKSFFMNMKYFYRIFHETINMNSRFWRINYDKPEKFTKSK